MKRFIFVLLFALLSFTLAQGVNPDIETKFGIPAGVLSTLIGTAAGYLVFPVTGLIKKLGGTKGATTVSVSIVLAALVNILGGYFGGLYPTFLDAVWASIISVFVANGAYFATGAAKTSELAKGERRPLNPGE